MMRHTLNKAGGSKEHAQTRVRFYSALRANAAEFPRYMTCMWCSRIGHSLNEEKTGDQCDVKSTNECVGRSQHLCMRFIELRLSLLLQAKFEKPAVKGP